MNVKQMITNLMMRNPAVADNPNAKAMLEVVSSGDQAKGEEIANNLLNTYGVSKEDALRQAREFFGI